MSAPRWEARHFFAGCYQVIGPDWQQCNGFMGMSENQARPVAESPAMAEALRGFVKRLTTGMGNPDTPLAAGPRPSSPGSKRR